MAVVEVIILFHTGTSFPLWTSTTVSEHIGHELVLKQRIRIHLCPVDKGNIYKSLWKLFPLSLSCLHVNNLHECMMAAATENLLEKAAVSHDFKKLSCQMTAFFFRFCACWSVLLCFSPLLDSIHWSNLLGLHPDCGSPFDYPWSRCSYDVCGMMFIQLCSK